MYIFIVIEQTDKFPTITYIKALAYHALAI